MNNRTRVCESCGALISGDAGECTYCGRRLPSAAASKIRDTLGLIVPRWCPVANSLIVANIANFLVLLALFGGGQILAPTTDAMMAMGSLIPYLFHSGQYWRIITYGFLHIGIIHIAFNMMALSQVGTALEDSIGGARLFVIYMLSLLGGGAADVIVRGASLINIAGASGALFGLIGFGMSFAHFYGGSVGQAQRRFFLHWAIYGFAFGYLINADNICHLGGFIVGAALGYPIEKEIPKRDQFTPYWRALAVGLLLVTVAAFVWMIL